MHFFFWISADNVLQQNLSRLELTKITAHLRTAAATASGHHSSSANRDTELPAFH
jgi:hypothetical protein